MDNICVSKTQLKRGEQKYNNIINEYTKLDPTLPRISNVPCPNTECPSNKGLGDGEGEGEGSGEGGRKKSEVVYLRYDDINMKLICRPKSDDVIPHEWIIHSEFDPLKAKVTKTNSKKPLELLKGKCIYVRLQTDASSDEALKDTFEKAPEGKVRIECLIASSKQHVTIHFKNPEDTKAAIGTINTIQIDRGFRVCIL